MRFVVVLLAIITGCAIIAVGVVAAVGLTAQAIVRYECRVYEQQSGIETEFDWVAGCYVRSGNKMIPYSEYKARAITNEEKPQ